MQPARGSAGDQLVLGRRVDLEQEELAVDDVAARGELDRLPEDRRGLVRVLDGRHHVAAARGLARLADRRAGLLDHVGRREPRRAERAEAARLGRCQRGGHLVGRASEETEEPLIVNVPGENRPSVPKITAFLCCWARLRPNCCALAAICQGRTTTVVVGVTLATSEEKSVTFCETDSWSTLMPADLKIG